jgi:hypothetical protein
MWQALCSSFGGNQWDEQDSQLTQQRGRTNERAPSNFMTTTIPHTHVAASTRLDLVYATILGADLGPNLTHLGL